MPTKFEQSLAVLTDYFLSDLPPIDENYEFSAKFERRMEKLIRRYAKPYYMLINTAAKRVACIIICIIVALSALTISVRAFLPDVWNMIVEWFDEYIMVGYSVDTNVAPDTIKDIRPPKFVPEGLEMSGELRSETVYQTDYTKDEFIVCKVKQYTYKRMFMIDNSTFIQNVQISEYSGMFSTINNERFLSWDDGEYYYVIENYDRYLSDDDMITIAESIYD